MTRFVKMELRDGQLVETEAREIKQSDLRRCPHFIMVAEHYRDNGSCRCDDATHREMREWGYKWRNGKWS